MRRLTLLLCLLMAMALRLINGSGEALTRTLRRDAALPKRNVTRKAVNTSFRANPVRVDIRREGAAWTLHHLLQERSNSRRYLTDTILNRWNRRVDFGLIQLSAFRNDRKSPSGLESGISNLYV